MPPDMPAPKGKPVTTTVFEDANPLHDVIAGRSCAGLIHMLDKTPTEWHAKKMNTVETSAHGSEFVAARTGIDQTIDLRCTLRMLGVLLKGPSWMFGDNQAAVNGSSVPSGQLKKRENVLNCHRVREAAAAGCVNFVHMPGKENPADMCIKPRSSREWCQLMKPLTFWRHRDEV